MPSFEGVFDSFTKPATPRVRLRNAPGSGNNVRGLRCRSPFHGQIKRGRSSGACDSRPAKWLASYAPGMRETMEKDMSESSDLQENLAKIANNPSYRLAQEDLDFLSAEELRPLRLQLELLKPELALEANGVVSTVVVFGGTRIIETDAAEKLVQSAKEALTKAPNDVAAQRALAIAERKLAKSPMYDEAREFGRLVSTTCQVDGKCEFVIVTGGGPGVMEAANRGAFDVGAKTIGLNITLPHEQLPNAYITPDLCFQFKYFAIRKMHFLLRAKALIAFPGGFGTLDELFCTLTLRQVNRMQALPIVLFSREYWERLIDFQFLADEGVIADEDLDLFTYAETAQEAWQAIAKFYNVQV